MIEVLADIEDKHLNFVKSSSRIKKGRKVKEYKPYGELTSKDIFNSRISFQFLIGKVKTNRQTTAQLRKQGRFNSS